MSWNPFSKPSVKPSIISMSDERDFQREVDKLRQLEFAAKKLHKDMKKYTDSTTALLKGEMRLCQNLKSSSLVHQDKESWQAVDSYEQSLPILSHSTSELTNAVHKVMAEPLRRYTSVHIPNMSAAIKKRDMMLHDCNQRFAKVQKYQQKEKTGTNIVKLDQAKKSLAPVQAEFERFNTSLMEEVPRFYDGRVRYIQPSLAALITAQIHYNKEILDVYKNLDKQLNGSKGSSYTDEIYNYQMEKRLQEIRKLSIVADD